MRFGALTVYLNKIIEQFGGLVAAKRSVYGSARFILAKRSSVRDCSSFEAHSARVQDKESQTDRQSARMRLERSSCATLDLVFQSRSKQIEFYRYKRRNSYSAASILYFLHIIWALSIINPLILRPSSTRLRISCISYSIYARSLINCKK